MIDADSLLEFSEGKFAAKAVSLYLSRIERGYSEDLRTPLYGRETPRVDIIEKWDHMFIDEKGKLPQVMVEVEASEREKIGPYSIMLPYAERRKDVAGYFERKELSASIDNSAVRKVASLLHAHRLRPVSLDLALKSIPKSTNWGLPFFKKGSVGSSLYLEDARNIIHGDTSILKIPCLLGWRGQPKGLQMPPKQRVVWMYPHAMSLVESTFTIPLIGALRSACDEFKAWNDIPLVDAYCTDILAKQNQLNVPMISFDASAYDQSISESLIREAFSIIKFWFQESYRDLISLVEEYFVSCGILTPDGLVDGVHGVPSGSGFTNIIDSIVQLILYHHVSNRLGLGTSAVTVQGDDGLWGFEAEADMNQFENELSSLGITANADKQQVSVEYASFLQRWYFVERGSQPGIRSSYRTLNGMLSYERFRNGWTYVHDVLRWIMQLEAASGSPLHESLTKFAMLGDTYRLGTNLKGSFPRLFRMMESDDTKATLDLGRFAGQVTGSGMPTFLTVETLRRSSGRLMNQQNDDVIFHNAS